jgi:hypothetical protein
LLLGYRVDVTIGTAFAISHLRRHAVVGRFGSPELLPDVVPDIVTAIVVRATIDVDNMMTAPIAWSHNDHSAMVISSKMAAIWASLNINDVVSAPISGTRC